MTSPALLPEHLVGRACCLTVCPRLLLVCTCCPAKSSAPAHHTLHTENITPDDATKPSLPPFNFASLLFSPQPYHVVTILNILHRSESLPAAHSSRIRSRLPEPSSISIRCLPFGERDIYHLRARLCCCQLIPGGGNGQRLMEARRTRR